MNYNEACEILKVNQSDSIEDIRKKYLELVSKYHPDVNQTKESTEMTQKINDAYEFIKKNYNNFKSETEDITKNDEELSFEEFSAKYMNRNYVQQVIKEYKLSMHLLYVHYKHNAYLEILKGENPLSFSYWIYSIESLNLYCKYILNKDILVVIDEYATSKEFKSTTLQEYVVNLALFEVKSKFGGEVDFYQMNSYLNEYLNEYLENDNNNKKTSFIEWLNSKYYNKSKDIIDNNINKIMKQFNFDGISDKEIMDIINVINFDKPGFINTNGIVRSKNNLIKIITYKVSQNPNVVKGANFVNEDISFIIEDYINEKRNEEGLSLEDYISYKVCVLSFMYIKQKDKVLKTLNELYQTNDINDNRRNRK